MCLLITIAVTTNAQAIDSAIEKTIFEDFLKPQIGFFCSKQELQTFVEKRSIALESVKRNESLMNLYSSAVNTVSNMVWDSPKRIGNSPDSDLNSLIERISLIENFWKKDMSVTP